MITAIIRPAAISIYLIGSIYPKVCWAFMCCDLHKKSQLLIVSILALRPFSDVCLETRDSSLEWKVSELYAFLFECLITKICQFSLANCRLVIISHSGTSNEILPKICALTEVRFTRNTNHVSRLYRPSPRRKLCSR